MQGKNIDITDEMTFKELGFSDTTVNALAKRWIRTVGDYRKFISGEHSIGDRYFGKIQLELFVQNV